MSNRHIHDSDDYDELPDLPPHLLAQVERFERQESSPARGRYRGRRMKLRARRRLEDYRDERRMRDEIDYLR